MKIPCSSCNQRLEIPDELAGQTIECPACNASLAVPVIEAPPPTTSRVEVTTPQAVAPQQFSPKRKTEAQPKAASNKKPKSSIPKWAIASVASTAVVVVVSIMFWLSETRQILLEAKEIETIEKYIDPIDKGNIKAVKQYLAAGADVNMNLPSEWTLLHHAADRPRNPRKELVKILIDAGANVNAKNPYGLTPLDHAQSLEEKDDLRVSDEVYLRIKSAKKEIAALLRKHGGKTGEELKAEGK